MKIAENKDLFSQRTQLIEELIEFNNNEDNRICALVGEWGSGKSFFIDKFVEHIKKICDENEEGEEEKLAIEGKNTFEVLVFDAWENQAYGNINSIFLEFMFDELQSRKYQNKPYLEYMKDHGKEWIGEFSKIFSDSILPKPASKAVGVITNGYKEFKEQKMYKAYGNQILNQIIDEKNFYDILIEMLIKEEKYLIIIDELDRCDPKFAMELIKKVIYLNKKLKKSDNKVNFLIAINKVAFENLLKGFYGMSYDTHQYFDKIFDYEFELPVAKGAFEYVGELLTTPKNGRTLEYELEEKLNMETIEKFKNLNYRKLNLLIEVIQKPKKLVNEYYGKGFNPDYYYDLIRFTLEVVKMSSYHEYLGIINAIRRLKSRKIYSINLSRGILTITNKIEDAEKFFDDITTFSKYFKYQEMGVVHNGNLEELEINKLKEILSVEVLSLMWDYPI
ncbi:MAG: hypothetical protein CVU99_02285 [Firmicutes bacterium HGW-Firmicutes-4]|jgi:hypothetical protein|nr:MAG: hypothetical protein CVU99_02285 [Firmicutes bacterium HGW-Firmicutes-4]